MVISYKRVLRKRGRRAGKSRGEHDGCSADALAAAGASFAADGAAEGRTRMSTCAAPTVAMQDKRHLLTYIVYWISYMLCIFLYSTRYILSCYVHLVMCMPGQSQGRVSRAVLGKALTEYIRVRFQKKDRALSSARAELAAAPTPSSVCPRLRSAPTCKHTRVLLRRASHSAGVLNIGPITANQTRKKINYLN